MTPSLSEFLEQLKQQPETIDFATTMGVMDYYYAFTPTAFQNGPLQNLPGQNNGSCKIFAFGLIHELTAEQTLHCFGDYYRRDVLGDPDGEGHQNIRQFMRSGWQGIVFQSQALQLL